MSINISELIWTVICFFVLLVVLKKLLFDPLVSFMAARDARIQDGLNAGRTAQQQLDAAARARSEAPRQQAAAADALLAEANTLTGDERLAKMEEAEKILIQEDGVIAPTFFQTRSWVAKSDVRGIIRNGCGLRVDYKYAYIVEE